MFVVELPNNPEAANFIGVLKLLVENDELFLAFFVGLFSGVLPMLKLASNLALTSHIFLNLWIVRVLSKFAHMTATLGFLDVMLTALTLFVFLVPGRLEVSSAQGLLAFTGMVSFTFLGSRLYNSIEYRLDH